MSQAVVLEKPGGCDTLQMAYSTVIKKTLKIGDEDTSRGQAEVHWCKVTAVKRQ